ncbi:MAG: hypothetical protein QF858_01310 [Candidatus Pacebacteria bacterium]|nr:hypothetical protein [bacterium]MDP6527502.1 hypothetical protein [Candidatus Paceibacterota bacterium]MDP6659864.1 hypothetical protein [Candidatus Paceibacterota bacterium]
MAHSLKKSTILISILFSILFLLSPFYQAEAIIPFGGMVITLTPCLNAAIHVLIGPPRPGPYIWQAGLTLTFLYGPPSHPGQWTLGRAGPVGLCIIDYSPFVVIPGLTMLILGTSI